MAGHVGTILRGSIERYPTNPTWDGWLRIGPEVCDLAPTSRRSKEKAGTGARLHCPT